MNFHWAKSREAVLDLHLWKWQGNECSYSALWVLESVYQGHRACPVFQILPFFPQCCTAVGLFHAGLGLLFSTGLLFSVWGGQVAKLPSAQHWPHPLHTSSTRHCLGEAREHAEAGQTQFSSVPVTRPWLESVMWHWGLAQLCYSHSISEARTSLTTSLYATGRWILWSCRHKVSTTWCKPSLPVGLSLAQRFPLFILGGKGAEHNLNHLWESLEPTWCHPDSASLEQSAARPAHTF